MGRIPDHIIDQVRDAADIVEVIGKHVQLKRASGEFKGLCPFHDERTPSFGVNPSKRAYYCFGCGAGGSVIRFLMDYHNLPFPEAVKQLAQQYNIQIVEEELDPQAEQRRKLLSRLKLCNKDAANWFHRLLMRSPVAAGARTYLKGRGISSEVARRWGLGYAPDGQAIVQWAMKKGYPVDVLVQAGLAGYRQEGQPHLGAYPRFRDRLMFPICDENGAPVAFSGRLLDAEAKTAKYLNSPETPIFDKGRLFFGLHLSKRPILKAKSAIICEGQIDLIACFEAGIENVVAPLGTGFTEAHAKILKRHADEAVLLNDSDAAGFKASVRAFGTLAGAGILVRAGQLPQGEDPDSLLRKAGPEALRALIENAKEFHDFQIDRRSAELDMTTVRARVQLAREVAETAAKLSDKAAQDALISHAATRLRLGPDEFRTLVAEAAREAKRFGGRGRGRGRPEESEQPALRPPTEFPDRAIALLCVLALTDAETQRFLRAHAPEAGLEEFPCGKLLLRIVDSAPIPDGSSPITEDAFLNTLPTPDEQGIRLLLSKAQPGGGIEAAEQALLRLRIRSLESRIAVAKAEIDDPNITMEERSAIFATHRSLKEAIQEAQRRLAPTEPESPPSGPKPPPIPPDSDSPSTPF